MTNFVRNAWYAGALASEVGEGLFARRLLNEPVLFYRTASGDPVALHDRCPHRFAYLHTGRKVGDQVECGYHGLRFDAGGRCTRSPYGESPPDNARVATWPVVERHGVLWIWMGDREKADPAAIPDHAHLDDPALRPILAHETFAGHYLLGTDNLMELTHLFWLHTSTIGGYKEEAGPAPGEEYSVRQVGAQVHSRTLTPNMSRRTPIDNGIDPAEPYYDQWNDTVWDCPSNMKFRICASLPGQRDVAPYMLQSHLITPETEGTSHYFWGVARTFDLFPEADARYTRFFGNIFRTEDAPMMADIQENMGDKDLWDMHPVVLPRDRGAVLVRRLVAKALAAERSETETVAAE